MVGRHERGLVHPVLEQLAGVAGVGDQRPRVRPEAGEQRQLLAAHEHVDRVDLDQADPVEARVAGGGGRSARSAAASAKPWAPSAMRARLGERAVLGVDAVDADADPGQSATAIVTELMTTSSCGRSPPPVGTRCISSSDLEALHDLAEQVVLRRQLDAACPEMRKNWLPFVFGPGVGHRHRADLVLAGLRQLVGEPVAGAAPAGAGRVAALAHEAVDDAVEDRRRRSSG